MNLETVLAWLKLLPGVITAGEEAWTNIKTALADNGADADTLALTNVALDAERRRQQAEAEAGAQS